MLGLADDSPLTGGTRVHQVDERSELRTGSLTAATASPASGELLTQPTVDARSWGILALLCFVYGLNFLDRQLLSILAKPIQDSLHVTDGQLGLIGGLYFAFFYCFIAVPVGWFADRTNRVSVLSLACAIWSAATMACGFAVT
jgi:sugar phosphate permease